MVTTPTAVEQHMQIPSEKFIVPDCKSYDRKSDCNSEEQPLFGLISIFVLCLQPLPEQ